MNEAAIARRGVGLARASVVGLAGIILMWLSVAVTLAMTMADAQPRLALALWPSAAVARTAAALGVMAVAPTPGRPGTAAAHEALALAGGALAREPVLAAAASTLGAASALGGDERRADTAYGYAERLSRRDLQSQLWFIERAVRRGDVTGALVHYDIALRANPAFVGETLLPVMARASAGAAVRGPLIGMLRRKPSWWLPYLRTMLTASLPPVAVAEQLAGAHLDPADPAQATILSNGLTQLVEAKQYRLAAAVLPGRHGGLRNAGFERAPSLLPFDWWLATDDDLAAYREPGNAGDGSYVLRIASKDRGGPVARQLVVLPAGRWVLGGLVGNGGVAGGLPPSIAIACGERPDPLATASLAMPADGAGRFALAFTVPGQGCEAQWITVSTPAGGTVTAWIDALTLQRTTDASVL